MAWGNRSIAQSHGWWGGSWAALCLLKTSCSNLGTSSLILGLSTEVEKHSQVSTSLRQWAMQYGDQRLILSLLAHSEPLVCGILPQIQQLVLTTGAVLAAVQSHCTPHRIFKNLPNLSRKIYKGGLYLGVVVPYRWHPIEGCSSEQWEKKCAFSNLFTVCFWLMSKKVLTLPQKSIIIIIMCCCYYTI